MGVSRLTFREHCMLIEDTGTQETTSRSQMKEVLKVEEEGGTDPQGTLCRLTLSWPVDMLVWAFLQLLLQKEMDLEKNKGIVFCSPAKLHYQVCARCPAQRIWAQEGLPGMAE